MASPQVEDGYTTIANEILEALAGINLSPYEGRALFFLIRKTYGWHKKTDWISLSQFSKGLALDRRLVFRALKGLEHKCLVVISRDDKKHPTYGFNKNYSKWKMSDFHKSAVNESNLKRKLKKQEREEKEKKEEKASVEMTRVSSVEIPTKETLTKETLKEERKEREERATVNPLSLSPKEENQNPTDCYRPNGFETWPVFLQDNWIKDREKKLRKRLEGGRDGD